LIIAATFEDKILKKIIHKFKYNFIENLAYPLSEILVQKILDLKDKKGDPNWVSVFWDTKPLLMPVPLHQKRERWRGFNQAERLGLNIANRLGLEFKNDLLTRVKNTKPQAKFNKQKRLKNIKGAFGINSALSDQIKNTNILLVDDVFTTGITMNECARILKRNGANKIWGIVLARG